MKKILPLLLILSGIGVAYVTWTGYQKAERAKAETELLRDFSASQYSAADDAPDPEPDYDPSDLDQTPPGVTPFIPTTACLGQWGNRLRQYCADGDKAELELIEGGSTQVEAMRVLTLCLDILLHQIDAHKTDYRPMDSKVQKNETNRQNLACEYTKTYGDNPVFNDGSIYYMVKEHVESGNINRLEK